MRHLDPFEQHQRNRVFDATRESAMAEARLAGMKIRAVLDPPRAAPAHFPYRHRTQAQVPHNGYVRRGR